MTTKPRTLHEKQAEILKGLALNYHNTENAPFYVEAERLALEAGAAALLEAVPRLDDQVCTDGYCWKCGGIALMGADYCDDHEFETRTVMEELAPEFRKVIEDNFAALAAGENGPCLEPPREVREAQNGDPVDAARQRLLSAVWNEGRCAPVSSLLDQFYEAVIAQVGSHGTQSLSEASGSATSAALKSTLSTRYPLSPSDHLHRPSLVTCA